MSLSFLSLRLPLRARPVVPPNFPFCVLVTGVVTVDFGEVAGRLADALGASYVSSPTYHNCTNAPVCTCDNQALSTALLAQRIAAGYRNGETLIAECRALTRGERSRLSIYPTTITLILAVPEHEAQRRKADALARIRLRLQPEDWRWAYRSERIERELSTRLTCDLLELDVSGNQHLISVADGTKPVQDIVEEFLRQLAALPGESAIQTSGALTHTSATSVPLLRRLASPHTVKDVAPNRPDTNL